MLKANLQPSRAAIWWRTAPALLRVGIFLLIAALVLAALVPGYRTFRSWRAGSLAEKAVSHLAEGDLQRAHELAAAALHLEPYSLHHHRLFAARFQPIDPEGALVHAHTAAAFPDAAEEDLQRYVVQCLDQDIAAGSAKALRRLLTMAPGKSAHWALAAEYERRRGHLQEALSHAERALTLDADNRRAQYLGASLAASADSPELREAGRSRLWKMAQDDDKVALSALSDLLADPPRTAVERERLLARVASHPLAGVEHQLAGERLRLLAAEDSHQEEAVLRRCLDTLDPEHRPLVLAWMNQVGHSERVMEVLPLEEAAKSRDLFLARADAMLRTGRAEALLDLLDPPRKRWPIHESSREFLVLQAARAARQDQRAKRIRRSLLEEAGRLNPPISLIRLGQRLESKGLLEDAIDTYKHLNDRFPGERSHVYDRLAHIYRRRGDSGALLELSREMHHREPENPVYRHNEAYLSILRGEALEDARAELEDLARDSRLAPSVCALALLAHREGDPARAQALVADLGWGALSPLDQRIVQLVTSNGEELPPPKALNLTLLPEEQSLFGLPPEAQ